MNERVLSAMAELFDVVNGSREKEIAESSVRAFNVSHRTLQQGFMRSVVVPILVDLSAQYEAGRYDGRNEATCKLAFELLKGVSEDDLYLPYV